MKLHFIKFYPNDWLSDYSLRLCSPLARALWVEMLMLMAKCERYGYLCLDGQPMSSQKLADWTLIPHEQVVPLLAELRAAKVYDTDEAGFIFSRRLVRDYVEIKQGYERQKRFRQKKALQGGDNKRENNAEITAPAKHSIPSISEWTDQAGSAYPEWPMDDAKAAWHHYEAKGWMIGKSKVKDWRRCVGVCFHNWKKKQPIRSPKHSCESPSSYRDERPVWLPV